MIAIQLHFPTGKLHATPWGRQVNEGAVEWPPSPWRILRALIAVWHNKFPDVPRSEVEPLIEKLTEPPSFALPPASQAHTRHYMPAANDTKTKIFDTFVVVPRANGPDSDRTSDCRNGLIIVWPHVRLSSSEVELLDKVVRAMSYFGRAESWVIAELMPNWSGTPNAMPLSEVGVAPDQHLERVLGPELPGDFSAWRQASISDRQTASLAEKIRKEEAKGTSSDKVKLTAADIKKIEVTLPETLFDALHAETNDLRKAGWNRPPGSRWLEYVRPASAFDSKSPATAVTQTTRKPTVARYAVAGKVVPRLTDALRIGERARKFLMGISGKSNDGHVSAVFSGKDADGNPLQRSHGHAHFLCEAIGDSAKITHMTVYAPMGFEEADERALSRLVGMWGDEGHDLQFVLLGIGQPEDFGGLKFKVGQSPNLASSQVWTSRTPFVLPRHLKIKGEERSSPESIEAARKRELINIVRRELMNREQFRHLYESAEIEPLLTRNAGTRLGATETQWLKFDRIRAKGGGSVADSQGYGFRLSFSEQVSGPLALGYGCHFGLGQFVPEEAAK